MGMPVLFVFIAFLIDNVGGFSLLGSADFTRSPTSTPSNHGLRGHEGLVAASHSKEFHNLSPVYNSPTKAPTHHKGHIKKWVQGSEPSPSISFHKYHHGRKHFGNFAPHPSTQGPSVSPFHYPIPSPRDWSTLAPAPSPTFPSSQVSGPTFSPSDSPSMSNEKIIPPKAVLVLPPPPPSTECTSVTCTEPLTHTPTGSPCACVWPIEVRLLLSISPYTFFPLVTELANEISKGFSLNTSQTRIMGANAAGEQLEKTIVLVNLVPLKTNFDPTTALLIYRKFWKKQVFINTSLFGAYQVVYIHYPGLPPSPPTVPSNAVIVDDQPYPGSDHNGRPFKPLGVDVPRRTKNETNRSMIAVVVLSSVSAFVVCMGVLWLLLLKCRTCSSSHPEQTPHELVSSHEKQSGAARSLTLGSRPTSATLSFDSNILSYTGTAKIFSMGEIERATNNFDAVKIIGEGGFGLVYSGILDDGRKVAVKVLKREDHQGSREFLAEVEMLSRLHHRNLVKLIGICSEDHFRSLVYELIPNGSLEFHLHGGDKGAEPLGWCARLKIALGAARGLAYLHEDSNPRVIHRDFKSSNILLENDFTPKVSDFGLARAALDEGNKHISTHVMGTFGYLAPEYAMTGHLLVKSDVYSYGVVLLELLTGRKPVDLSQPPGQENLVAWVRPLLSNKEGLELAIDPKLKSNIPFDSIVKVAAIASMCVQPEVSHRPFMGEVVQALKLVCNEFEEIKETLSRSCSTREDFELAEYELAGDSPSQSYYPIYPSGYDTKIGLSTSDLKGTDDKFEGMESESFRRQFNSAPLRMGRRWQFWQRSRGLTKGSMSEHGFSSKL